MRRFPIAAGGAVASALVTLAVPTGAWAQSLLTFGVLGAQSVTNTGPTVITGDLGVSPGTSITGFSPGNGIVVAPYSIHQTDGVANQAQSDLTTAYNVLAARPFTQDLTGVNLAGQLLSPGVYNFDTSAALDGTLTLDAQGDPNAVFIFQIGSTLTAGGGSLVELVNGAQGANVYFIVGSSATLNTTAQFKGRILALISITLNTGATINCGAALARTGSVTLDTNTILVCPLAEVTLGDDLDDTATDNAVESGTVIDQFVNAGGVLPLGFGVLDILTPTELAAALVQLSGEAGTGAAPTAVQAMGSFLSLLSDRLGIGSGMAPGGPGQSTGPGTVRVLGYASAEPPPHTTAAVFVSANGTARPAMPPPDRFEAWGSVYGGQNVTAGDGDAGLHQRSANTFGLAFGMDTVVSPGTRVGFALGGGVTNFGLSDGLGSGRSDMFQAAIYARKDSRLGYLTGALAYAWHDVSTNRFVTIGGIDQFAARFSAHNIAGQIEGGYRLGALTPYAAVRMQAVFTPAYGETTVAGSTTFALDYDSKTTAMVRTELGVGVGHTIAVHDGGTLELTARTAWAHDTWTNTSASATFQSLPGSNSFTVFGARPSPNSWLVSAGAEIRFVSGLALAARFNGEFAQHAQTYAGMGRVSYSW